MKCASIVILSLTAYWHIVNAATLSGRLSATPSFEEFVRTYKRTYAPGSTEYAERRALFTANAKRIGAQNARPGSLWRAGINQFADRTQAELEQTYGWSRDGSIGGHSQSATLFGRHGPRKTLEAAVDWTVSSGNRPALLSLDVKNALNQGHCGSCWAFAAISLIHSHYEILMNSTFQYSTQQLVSCVQNPQQCGGLGGCKGATTELALSYVQSNGLENLMSEGDYPYTASDNYPYKSENCLATKNPDATKSLSMVVNPLPENKYEYLLAALADGPVVVSVGPDDWHGYEAGIYDGCYTDAVIRHAVLAVGYGQNDHGVKFWKIRNSWGADWGEEGFMRLFREDNPICGWDYSPEKGIECKPFRNKVKVCGMCGILYHPVALELSKIGSQGNLRRSSPF